MNHKTLLTALIFYVSSLQAIHPETSSYLTKHLGGCLQMPTGIPFSPEVRIFSSGRIIPTKVNKKNCCVTFEIPEDKYQTHFFALIIDPLHIQWQSKEDEPNVIDYLKIDPSRPHKFYQLSLKKDVVTRTFVQQKAPAPEKKKRDNNAWTITQLPLSITNGRLPDESIIICIPPHLIDRLENNHALALPTIVLKDGPEITPDIFNECLLTAMNLDTIHGRIDTVSKPKLDHKIILAMNV